MTWRRPSACSTRRATSTARTWARSWWRTSDWAWVRRWRSGATSWARGSRSRAWTSPTTCVALEKDPPQVFTINWIADYPSPYALYSLLLLPRAASNYGGWTDPTFVRAAAGGFGRRGRRGAGGRLPRGRRVRRRAGAADPVVVPDQLVAGATRPARAWQPDDRHPGLREGVMGRLRLAGPMVARRAAAWRVAGPGLRRSPASAQLQRRRDLRRADDVQRRAGGRRARRARAAAAASPDPIRRWWPRCSRTATRRPTSGTRPTATSCRTRGSTTNGARPTVDGRPSARRSRCSTTTTGRGWTGSRR